MTFGGNNPEFESVSTENVNNEVYASQFDGAGLASKIENALNWLNTNVGGYGTVRVTPKDDGTAWSWDKDLVLDLAANGGAEISVANGVEIEYPGSGWAITVDNRDSFSGPLPDSTANLELHGGVWFATTDDCSGWCRIIDSLGGFIDPQEVTDFDNSSGNGTGVKFENWQSYCENYHVRGEYTRVDRGIDYEPQSSTGGSGGSDSFHDSYIENVAINAFDFGIRLRGDWDYGLIAKAALFAKADGARCLVLGTDRADGTTITAMKCESPGNSNNTIAIDDIGFDDFYSPTIIGSRVDGFGIDTVVDSSKGTAGIGMIYARGGGYRIQNLDNDTKFEVLENGDVNTAGALTIEGETNFGDFSGSLGDGPNYFLNFGSSSGLEFDSRDGGYIHIKQPTVHPVLDLTTYGGAGKDRAYAHHDGTGGNPEGLYYADDANSQWVELGGSKTIPY